jgi:hypothetical protein
MEGQLFMPKYNLSFAQYISISTKEQLIQPIKNKYVGIGLLFIPQIVTSVPSCRDLSEMPFDARWSSGGGVELRTDDHLHSFARM